MLLFVPYESLFIYVWEIKYDAECEYARKWLGGVTPNRALCPEDRAWI